MELVYLWVEDYKNIHRQGFNFSPRFECEFDGENLIITEKKEDEYIKDFFGDKINITAIIGKNGSGKSNLLNLIFNNDAREKRSREHFYIIDTKNGCFLYYFKFMILKSVKKLVLKQSYTIEEIREESVNPQYNLSVIYFSNIYQSLPMQDRVDKTFHNIATSYLIDKYSKDSANKEIISYRWAYFLYLSQSIVKTLIMLENTTLSLPFDKPTKLNIVLDISYTEEEIQGIKLLYDNQAEYTFSAIAKRNIIYNYFHNYLDEIKQKDFTKKIETLGSDYIEKTYLLIKKNIPLDDVIDDFLEEVKGDDKKDFLISMNISDLNKNFIDKLEKVNSLMVNVSNIIDIFDFNWSPDLSTGQEAFLFQFANFYNVIKDSKEEDIMILIDEGETTMHPNWQKRYLNYYIEFLKNNFKNKKLHLVLTSHSPFILSDLVKENVIFLKDGKQVKGTDKKQTFGANIHTLLSDSFFMEDGLMGEFAKGKIDKAIKLLNKDKLDEDELKYCEQIISIIGEPIVKNQLQRMLDSKRLSKIDVINQKIKDMSYELEILKQHQDKIVQDELRNRGKKQYKQRFEDD